MEYNIKDYGAISNGKTLNTSFIQKAIDEASLETNSTVIIPEGVFLTGAIYLKKGVNLQIDGTLLGSSDVSDYPMVKTRFEGHEEVWPDALINIDSLSDFTIKGKGTVDGNGIPYYKKFWEERDEAIKKGLPFVNKDVPRPRLFYIRHCSNFSIEGIHLKNSGFWNLHLYDSKDVTVRNVHVSSPHEGEIRAASTDGIDIDACENVVLRDSYFEVDDDCICIKGGKGPNAHLENKVTKNILVEDCVIGFGHGAVTFGSEACLVENVTIRNLKINGENQVVRFKFRGDTNQSFKNILFENIDMTSGIVFAIRPWISRQDEVYGDDKPSLIENLTVRNVVAKDVIAPGMILADPPLTVIKDLVLENISIETAKEEQTLSRHDAYEEERSALRDKLELENISSCVISNVKVNGIDVLRQ